MQRFKDLAPLGDTMHLQNNLKVDFELGNVLSWIRDDTDPLPDQVITLIRWKKLIALPSRSLLGNLQEEAWWMPQEAMSIH